MSKFRALIDARGVSLAELARRVNCRLAAYGEDSPFPELPVRNLGNYAPLAEGETKKVGEPRWLCFAFIELGATIDEADAVCRTKTVGSVANLRRHCYQSVPADREDLLALDRELIWDLMPERNSGHGGSAPPAGLRLLGVVGDQQRVGRSAIVLPTFVYDDVGPRLEKYLLAHPDPKIQEVATDLADFRYIAHSRHDLLLANDIGLLFHQAGIAPPLLLKDSEATEALTQGKGRAFSVEDEAGETCVVSTVISIGLFSNDFTKELGKYDDVPFSLQLATDRGGRAVMVDDIAYELDEADDARGEGFIVRIHRSDLLAVVLGGTTAVGTVRLGDFLGRWANEIWADHKSDNALVGLANAASLANFVIKVTSPRPNQRVDLKQQYEYELIDHRENATSTLQSFRDMRKSDRP